MTAYLDHAATSPLRQQVLDVVTAQLGETGNASSLHASGRRGRRVVEESRERIASALGCRPGDVVFTSGGTESDNLALKGTWWARRAADPSLRRIVGTTTEHHAVLDALHWLESHEGADVDLLPVDDRGRVDPDRLEAALAPGGVALATVMWANNEVGTVAPVAALAEVAARHGVPLHTDAVQAVAHVPVDVSASGVDALTLTAHKLGGPLGVGALVVGRDVAVMPLLHGGGHERDVRSGTVPVSLVAGFATAVEAAVAGREAEAQRLCGLRDRLERRVREVVPDAVVNGDLDHRLPGLTHLSFPGCEGDSLLMLLDAQGVECSTGSACSAGVPEASHVLLAMGRGDEAARSSLRFSLGHTSTEADVDAVVAAIGPVVERARAAGVVALGRAG